MTSINQKIINRIQRKRRGWVFTPKDFLDLGTRAAVDNILSRLVAKQKIRRLSCGLYDYPRKHPLFGILSPDPDQIARALAGSDRVLPSGAVAANMLGLSTQVPARPVYVTNATVRARSIGGRTIQLKRAHVPLLDNVPDRTNLLLQALSYLGKVNVDDDTVQHCAQLLDDADLADLTKAMHHVPGWMADTLHKITREAMKYK